MFSPIGASFQINVVCVLCYVLVTMSHCNILVIIFAFAQKWGTRTDIPCLDFIFVYISNSCLSSSQKPPSADISETESGIIDPLLSKRLVKKSKTHYPIIALHCCVGHTAWAAEGREGRYEASPKGRKLEVWARRAPRLIVFLFVMSTSLSLFF